MPQYQLFPKSSELPDCFMCAFSENGKDNTCRRPKDLAPCGSESVYLQVGTIEEEQPKATILEQAVGSGHCAGCIFSYNYTCHKPKLIDPCDQNSIYKFN